MQLINCCVVAPGRHGRGDDLRLRQIARRADVDDAGAGGDVAGDVQVAALVHHRQAAAGGLKKASFAGGGSLPKARTMSRRDTSSAPRRSRKAPSRAFSHPCSM